MGDSTDNVWVHLNYEFFHKEDAEKALELLGAQIGGLQCRSGWVKQLPGRQTFTMTIEVSPETYSFAHGFLIGYACGLD